MSDGGILGTAGHIDHGKTALVRALTGVDTDRLAEEKARGITIELGFAELALEGGGRLGIVDVPGHRDFVRMMVAGATGMDVVVLVVAADEGVMPQTREHLAIVELLAVPELVVALTKRDLVEDEWLELVDEDVGGLLESSRWPTAPRIPTSVVSGEGLDRLVEAIVERSRAARRARVGDVTRLPADRVFTIQGTGTVVTGTLWSGSLARGERVRLLPGGDEARIRALQVHGDDVERAHAGARTAVALAGTAREAVERGATLVAGDGWEESWMLTVRAQLIADSPWALENRQRVRVHLGTAEVMARCIVLEREVLSAGDAGWIQLRLEEPMVARAGDRLVLRSYSPATTIGGGQVAEPVAPKRRRLDPATAELLAEILDGKDDDAVSAALALAGWAGLAPDVLPLRTGRTPAAVAAACGRVGVPTAGTYHFAARVLAEAEALVLETLRAEHARDPLRPVVPLEPLRAALPGWAPAALAGAALERLAGRGGVELTEGGARVPGHTVSLDQGQRSAADEILRLLREGGLAPPAVPELPARLGGRADFWPLLRHLESEGRIRAVADGFYLVTDVLEGAIASVVSTLGGRAGLSPADFREALPVTRKHLIPLLNHLDGLGVTIRTGDARAVPTTSD